eukprot:CAMPEP_0114611794 /NCGR_PEP_ID=MMETSP0168-20121206/4298_1 /TAXON_ID=95228 ORGANISM="Vannella sp., Strain DIVA3 517/6/12" /NCGR_SAMPLE_ID=MMETSP0168 /ASSEMBLY_ACC=CAM_ASM_000044 /LENGTH=202 /DNA_ID=CAMNT_0001822775 /DNA_START=53 /DNA_END=661 /DNA_ORIENTATION=-
MKSTQVIVALVLLACFATLGSCATPRVVVKRTVLNHELIVGQELIVNYKLFNLGDGAAYNVALVDDSFGSEHFEPVEGLKTAEWPRIAAGESVVHSFVVKPVEVGRVLVGVAYATYAENSSGRNMRVVRTADSGEVSIIKFSEYQMRVAPHLCEWGIFAAAVAAVVVLPYLQWSRYQSGYDRGLPKGSAIHKALLAKKKKNK